MKEVTRIITAEITCVEKVTDAEYEEMKKGKEAEDNLAKYIKYATKADDVHVKIQDFVMEKDEE